MKKSTNYAVLKGVFQSEIYWRIIFFFAGIGFAGMVLSSCSPITRHARIVKKYPFVHTQDSITFRDTIRVEIPKVQVDTFFSIHKLRDTITIEKERLKIQLWSVHDSIFVSGLCDTITIEKEIIRKVPIRYYVSKVERSWLKFIILAGVVLFALYSLLRKRDDEKKTIININENEKNTKDPL